MRDTCGNADVSVVSAALLTYGFQNLAATEATTRKRKHLRTWRRDDALSRTASAGPAVPTSAATCCLVRTYSQQIKSTVSWKFPSCGRQQAAAFSVQAIQTAPQQDLELGRSPLKPALLLERRQIWPVRSTNEKVAEPYHGQMKTSPLPATHRNCRCPFGAHEAGSGPTSG